MERYDEEIYFGRKSPWSGIQDHFINPGDGNTGLRKVLIADIGNPANVFLRRAGPDNVPHDHFPPQPLEIGQNVGHIAWQAYEGGDGDRWGARLAQVNVRYQGPGRGSFHILTSGVERLVVDADGRLDISGCADEQGRVPVCVNGRKGWLMIQWEA